MMKPEHTYSIYIFFTGKALQEVITLSNQRQADRESKKIQQQEQNYSLLVAYALYGESYPEFWDSMQVQFVENK